MLACHVTRGPGCRRAPVASSGSYIVRCTYAHAKYSLGSKPLCRTYTARLPPHPPVLTPSLAPLPIPPAACGRTLSGSRGPAHTPPVRHRKSESIGSKLPDREIKRGREMRKERGVSFLVCVGGPKDHAPHVVRATRTHRERVTCDVVIRSHKRGYGTLATS